MTDLALQNDGFEPIADVPIQMVNMYARLWQFETWLRTMIYVELRALLGDDWAQKLKINPKSFEADKSLTHMPTQEMNALSYTQLRELLGLIGDYWDCFSSYLPPQQLWTSKLIEIAQIRHRTAHFRVGHPDDLARLKQLLRDIDKGFWKFCTSYNSSSPILPQNRDAITEHFLPLDPLPWVEIEPNSFAKVGFRDKSVPVALTVELQRRPWAQHGFAENPSGYLYDFHFFAQDRRGFDLTYLLKATTRPA